MQSARVTQNIRRMIVLAALVALSAAASTWRTLPSLSPTTRFTVNLVPPIFTSAMAQTSTGCTGTPKKNDPDLGGQDGVLKIAMNSIKLIDYGSDGASGGTGTAADTETEVLSGTPPTPVDLDFASTTGTSVGNFASNVQVNANCAWDGGNQCAYEALKITVDNIFKIRCAVTCSGTTYRTQGGTSITAPDGTSLPAVTSNLDVGNNDASVTFPLSTPLVVTSGGSASKNIGFAASGACELWSIPGGNFKIMPKNLSASIQ